MLLDGVERVQLGGRPARTVNKKASGFGRLEAAFVPTGRKQGEEQNYVASLRNVQDIGVRVEAGSEASKR